MKKNRRTSKRAPTKLNRTLNITHNVLRELEKDGTVAIYSFCETVTATSVSKWHIRKTVRKDLKFGGGVTEPALCGRSVSWDIRAEVTQRSATELACSTCKDIYLSQVGYKS